MTISKGSTYGRPGVLPPGAPVAHRDAELAALVQKVPADGGIPIVGLAGGSLWRTLGGAAVPDRMRSPHAWRYPVDVLRVELDGKPFVAVASLVVRTARWHRALVAMNAQWLGAYQLGHRAHPGDGLVDAYEWVLRPRDLWKVAARARSGAHLPHPAIRERRVPEFTFTTPDGKPWRTWLDGERGPGARHVVVRVDADALTVVL